MAKSVSVGAKAPEATLCDHEGAGVALASLWQTQPVLLVFLRHFGCPHCRSHAIQLRRDEAKYRAAGAQIVLVGLGEPDKAAAFRRELDLPFTVICDPDKAVYRAYGLTRRMNLLREATPSNVARYASDAARYGMALTEQDMFQLGGVFVIDRAGIVRFAFTAMRAADFPPTLTLLAAIQDANKVAV
ncbi:MAG: AhpC/TSA family protein [Ktedonobacterales bacterium]|nr:AhpC/TSA family protein [Ktedonobacterales bacterium]